MFKLNILATYLSELLPRDNTNEEAIIMLSSAESRVAAMIKQGFSTNEIAHLLHISEHTVKSHRRAIRKKFGIWNSPIELSIYLKSKPLLEHDSDADTPQILAGENSNKVN